MPQTRDEQAQTVESIVGGIRFKGANLWVLIFAIFIASLGLNVNSTAVIIGAMLISPLMGPIIGMGLAVGITDFDLLKRSLKNYAVATGISVITATVYFTLTPLHEAQSELLARTSPNIYDVLIAFFGGLAGITAIWCQRQGQCASWRGNSNGSHAAALHCRIRIGQRGMALFLRCLLPFLHKYGFHKSGNFHRSKSTQVPEESLHGQKARRPHQEIYIPHSGCNDCSLCVHDIQHRQRDYFQLFGY